MRNCSPAGKKWEKKRNGFAIREKGAIIYTTPLAQSNIQYWARTRTWQPSASRKEAEKKKQKKREKLKSWGRWKKRGGVGTKYLPLFHTFIIPYKLYILRCIFNAQLFASREKEKKEKRETDGNKRKGRHLHKSISPVEYSLLGGKGRICAHARAHERDNRSPSGKKRRNKKKEGEKLRAMREEGRSRR